MDRTLEATKPWPMIAYALLVVEPMTVQETMFMNAMQANMLGGLWLCRVQMQA